MFYIGSSSKPHGGVVIYSYSCHLLDSCCRSCRAKGKKCFILVCRVADGRLKMNKVMCGFHKSGEKSPQINLYLSLQHAQWTIHLSTTTSMKLRASYRLLRAHLASVNEMERGNGDYVTLTLGLSCMLMLKFYNGLYLALSRDSMGES